MHATKYVASEHLQTIMDRSIDSTNTQTQQKSWKIREEE